ARHCSLKVLPCGLVQDGWGARPRGGVQPLSICEFATDSGGRPVTPAIAVTARAAHRLSRCKANRDWQWPLSVQPCFFLLEPLTPNPRQKPAAIRAVRCCDNIFDGGRLHDPMDSSCHLPTLFSQHPSGELDVIVAGGGPGGCVVAGRLAVADPSLKVMLIEGGANNRDDPWVSSSGRSAAQDSDYLVFKSTGPSPGIYVRNMQRNGINDKATFYIDTKASSYLRGRQSIVPRANILGGGSSINFQIYTRASASDWGDFCSFSSAFFEVDGFQMTSNPRDGLRKIYCL
ncbi:unnamed protein product, partial [Mycena citricolor]